jgi:5-methylcytosine-specific restriction endonuclease McrA
MNRICTKCKTEFPRTGEFFPAAKKMADGMSSWCRGCHRGHVQAWGQKNPEKVKARTDAWRENNPEEYRMLGRLHAQKRRSRKANAAGVCSEDQWMARFNFFGGLCWLQLDGCTGVGDTIDHVIPLSRGGTNWPSNLRPACGHCNYVKGTKLPSELEELAWV